MNLFSRRSAVGAISGAAASAALTFTFAHWAWSLVLGITIGAIYAGAVRPVRGAWEDSLMTGGSLGVVLLA
jgi:hypothetical protein